MMLNVDAPQGLKMRDGQDTLNVSWKGMEECVDSCECGNPYETLIDHRRSCILWNPADETGEGIFHDIPKGDGVSRPRDLSFGFRTPDADISTAVVRVH